ncbi:uncharacterized protein LOC141550051 [Sminthopsis crassicaudata]|uniref:uncharacterized protein LOC141550029 n=1 Tax=Sminthopsis crassicaudata TaxID=9301 RepID=UPI003D68A4A8
MKKSMLLRVQLPSKDQESPLGDHNPCAAAIFPTHNLFPDSFPFAHMVPPSFTDLSQDEKKSILKRAKSLLFRGPPHRRAPSSKKNGQEPDLEGQDDSIPATSKMEGKDIVATTSFSSRFTFPPIPTPPGSPKRLPKATRACPGQAAGAIPKRKSKVYSMLATECENTSSETEPELSSEDDAPQQEENSVWATKVLGAPWNRIGKECPELPTESKNSPGALSQSSFQWAQGDGPLPQEDSTACLIQGVSVLLWKRTNKVGLAPPTESETTPRDLCKLSFSCGQGKSPPPRQVSPAGTLKEVRAPRRGDNKISPARPKDPMVSSSVLLEPSFNWAQGEGHSSQETSPVWGIQGVSVLKKCKIGPLSLATESKTAPRAPSEASCSWAQGQCQPPQEAGPAFISRPCRLWRKMSKASSALPTDSKTAPRLPPEPSCIGPKDNVSHPKKLAQHLFPDPVVYGER